MMTTSSQIVLFIIVFIVLIVITVTVFIAAKKAPAGSEFEYRSLGLLAACGIFWIIAIVSLIRFIKSPH